MIVVAAITAPVPVVIVVVAVTLRLFEAGDLHRLGAAGKLPEQLVAAAERIVRARGRLGLEPVRELDAIDHPRLEARALRDVKLVAIAVARAQALIALARLVQRVEVHDQVELVVVAGRHPRIGIGVVGAGLVEDCERLAVAGRVDRDGEGREQHGGNKSGVFHIDRSPQWTMTSLPRWGRAARRSALTGDRFVIREGPGQLTFAPGRYWAPHSRRGITATYGGGDDLDSEFC